MIPYLYYNLFNINVYLNDIKNNKVAIFKNQTFNLLSKKNIFFYKNIGIDTIDVSNNKYHELYKNNIKLLEDIFNSNINNNINNNIKYNNIVDIYSKDIYKWMSENIKTYKKDIYIFESLSTININDFYKNNIKENIIYNKDFLITLLLISISMSELVNFCLFFNADKHTHIIFFNEIINFLNNNIKYHIDIILNINEIFLLKEIFFSNIMKLGIDNFIGLLHNSWFLIIIDVLFKIILNFSNKIIVENNAKAINKYFDITYSNGYDNIIDVLENQMIETSDIVRFFNKNKKYDIIYKLADKIQLKKDIESKLFYENNNKSIFEETEK